MRKAVYPGTFDPLTNGHLDVLLRGSRIFDHLVVAILNNSQKQPLFSLSERVEMVQDLTAALPNVAVKHFDGLLVDFAVRENTNVILRGIRGLADYEVENQMAILNRQLQPDLDTVFLVASPANAAVSSRVVKEISSLGGDLSAFVPPSIAEKLKRKFAAR